MCHFSHDAHLHPPTCLPPTRPPLPTRPPCLQVAKQRPMAGLGRPSHEDRIFVALPGLGSVDSKIDVPAVALVGGWKGGGGGGGHAGAGSAQWRGAHVDERMDCACMTAWLSRGLGLM